ncbi:hypothetical protein IAT38_005222 [Cryptococcus sp. DSM 104549]
MQRKALKQLGKVTQWTSEKVFSGEKTQLSSEFLEFEKEIEVRRIGIERLHATSLPFFEQLTKVKATSDPYPPAGSGKDKILYTEALGLVMIDYGDEIGDAYGDALAKYGRARCRLAAVQEDFSSRLGDSYIAGMESALGAVNEYKALRKKLDSRRLALDAAISKAQGSKKESAALEEEINIAKTRFEEVEEETHARMLMIQEAEEQQAAELTDLLEAELDYHTRCKDILDDLKSSWSSQSSVRPAHTSHAARAVPTTRSRSNTATSSRSLGRTAMTRSASSKQNAVSSEDEDNVKNRSRSQSNASSTGKGKDNKRSMLPSFGSLGKKSGLSNVTPKRKSFGKEKFGESRAALRSDAEDDDEEDYPAPVSYSSGRARSQSQLSSSIASYKSEREPYDPPPALRRTHTSPANLAARYVKALYEYTGNAGDELNLRVGQVIEVKTEVSEDWWIGESEGKSGLFPRAYTEEYIPSPQTAVPPMPARPRNLPPPVGAPGAAHTPGRTLPPPAGAHTPGRTMPPPPTTSHHSSSSNLPPSPNLSIPDSDDFESEAESHGGFSDADHHFTAALAPAAQPAPVRSAVKKAAPPPPPSRRAASSNNVLSLASSGAGSGNSSDAYLSPPQAAYGRARSGTVGTVKGKSAVASPFAGSEDDEADEAHAAQAVGPGGLSHGLGGMHIGEQNGGGVKAGRCASCGCEDFTQNVFKAKGTCSTCFHQH